MKVPTVKRPGVRSKHAAAPSTKIDEGASRVFQFGFYILSSVGLQNLLNKEVQPFPATILSFTSESDGKSPLNQRKKSTSGRKPRKKKKYGGGNRRARRRQNLGSTSDEKLEELLKNSPLTVSVNGSEKGPYTFHNGVLEFLQRALRFLAEARSCSPQQLVSRILFSFAETLGETLDQPSQKDLERAVNEAVRQAQENCGGGRGAREYTQTITLDRSVSGLIVSYREHDEIGMSSSKLSRVRRGMHFNIPLKPFDATVEFPKRVPRRLRYLEKTRKRFKKPRNQIEDEHYSSSIISFCEEQDVRSRMVVDHSSQENPPCSPQSFPPSPLSRQEVLSHFQEHTQNVLYRVRDELRGAQEHNDRARKATLNINDTHEHINLLKGGHSCSTKCKLESFCSARSILPVQYNVKTATYFEFEVIPDRSRKATPKVCVGLSTRSLPLSCLTGSARCSIGMNTSARVLKEGKCLNVVYTDSHGRESNRFSYSDTIGVCTKLDGYDSERQAYRVSVAFFIEGKRIYSEHDNRQENNSDEAFVLLVPESQSNVYPTVTLYSPNTSVTCRFAAQDMSHYYNSGSRDKSDVKYWNDIAAFAQGKSVLALDGNCVY